MNFMRWMSIIFAVVFAIAIPAWAQDVLTVGSMSVLPGATVDIPIYIKDIGATTLGMDRTSGSRIQGISVSIAYSPADAISNASITRSGIAASKIPLYEKTGSTSGAISYLALFDETSNPLLFTQPPPASGNEILTLRLTGVSGTVTLAPQSSITMLSNQGGTIGETTAAGTLVLVEGSVSFGAATSTSITSSVNPSGLGQLITFTARVAPASGNGVPTGSVQFKTDGANIGSPVTLDNGTAHTSTTALTSGAHTIAAVYSGDSTYASSTGTLPGGQAVLNGNHPTVSTLYAEALSYNTALLRGNVSSDGGTAVTLRGFCWSLEANPTTTDSCISAGNGTGSFTATPANLQGATRYHVRAFATNASGTAYGNALILQTPAGPGLRIRISANSLDVIRGESHALAVSVTSTNDFEGTVALSATGLPEGTTQFDPARLTLSAGEARTIKFTFTPSAHAALGSYSAVIAADGNGVHVTAPIQINVTEEISLILPLIKTGEAATADSSLTSGIALVNLSDSRASVVLSAIRADGSLVSGTGITNPKSISLDAGKQLLFVISEIFGDAIPSPSWLRITSNTSRVRGFFEYFDFNMNLLDGAELSLTPGTNLEIPDIRNPEAQLAVVNPGNSAASVVYELFGSSGILKDAATVPLSANASAATMVTALFPNANSDAGDHVRISSSTGIAAMSIQEKPQSSVKVMNAQGALEGGSVLYAPQYCFGGQTWRSTLSMVNLDPSGGRVSLELFDNSGEPMGKTLNFYIADNGKLNLSDQSLFAAADPAVTQCGYVRITGSGIRLAGSISFGDQGGNAFETELPLVSELKETMVFSQIASNDIYYMGIALLNPRESEASAAVQVLDRDGKTLAQKDISIPSKGRICKLLTEIFPELAGQSLSSGYIRLNADTGLAGYAIIGTTNSASLSAVTIQNGAF